MVIMRIFALMIKSNYRMIWDRISEMIFYDRPKSGTFTLS